MLGIPKSQYDLYDSEKEDHDGSTDFSDFETNDMYKRFKMVQRDLSEETETLYEKDKYYV